MQSQLGTKKPRNKLRGHGYLLFNKWGPGFVQIYVGPGQLWTGHGKSALFVKVFNVWCY